MSSESMLKLVSGLMDPENHNAAQESLTGTTSESGLYSLSPAIMGAFQPRQVYHPPTATNFEELYNSKKS